MSRHRSNPRRRREARANPHHHRVRHNRHHLSLHNPRRRRRNPALALPLHELLPVTGFAIVGGVAARALPEMVMPNKNNGILGYGANLATTVVLGWLAEKISKTAGIGVLVGGSVMTAGRIISDLMGQPIVTFADTISASSGNLSGDPAFHLGLYAPSYFPVPMSSSPQGNALMVSPNPNIQSVTPAAVVKTNKGQTAVLPLRGKAAAQPASPAQMSSLGYNPRFKGRFAS